MASNVASSTSVSARVSTKSYETALCVVPPAHMCRDIDSLRELYDQAYGKWPPHINLIYPFVDIESLPRAKDLIQAIWAEASGKWRVNLDQAGCFTHRQGHTIYRTETITKEHSCLERLRELALGALGQPNGPHQFHLTIGQSEDRSLASRDFLLSKASLLPDTEFEIPFIAVLVREKVPGQDKHASRMRLQDLIDIGSKSAVLEYASNSLPLTEYWLDSNRGKDDFATVDDDISGSTGAQAITQSCTAARPRITYELDSVTGKWRALQWPDYVDNPVHLTVSSYNVLVESEFPPAQDRYPSLVKNILSNRALADVLLLQEVSDEFLSHILTHDDIQMRYSYASHGPPCQTDIGPLASLRNIVILSRLPFSWTYLPLHRSHKGAIVARFGGVSTPFVVAGLHLTSGLTDGSTAAKKAQLQGLIMHLEREHKSFPWIVAGDFNITTSSYTISAALKARSISAQTVQTHSSLDLMLSETGLIDSWLMARVRGGDDESRVWHAAKMTNDPHDLYEGEDGATFNPQENALAANSSGTSQNRPQRYDRILFKGGNTLHSDKFNIFGDHPQEIASDHWGVRASMRMIIAPSSTSWDEGATSRLAAFQFRPAHTNLSISSSVTEVLLQHGMIPSKTDSQIRDQVYHQLGEVLNGRILGEGAQRPDVPLRIVPVGSYALGVWTNASDIDCLCIGTISSKTFFQLARQRINKAPPHLQMLILRRVDANSGTMLELSIAGIKLDLQYCPATRTAETWPRSGSPQHSDVSFQNLPILSLRKLKPFRDLDYIQRTIPDLAVFRLAYRFIKLWACQHGIYASRFGYLSGIHITLMLSIIHKCLAAKAGSVPVEDLIITFFHHYASFDWKNDMVYDPIFHAKRPRYQRSAREPMVILGFHAPNANVAHTSTVPGWNTLIKEFSHANKQLSEDGMTWTRFFEVPAGVEPARTLSDGSRDFLKSYDSYVRIDLQYWGRTQAKGRSVTGWLESRSLSLVVDVNKAFPGFDVRIWPARFTRTIVMEEGVSQEYHGCYLIGLANESKSESQLTRSDRESSRSTLVAILHRFEEQLHKDEKYYDPATSWVGVSLIKRSDLGEIRLDDRDWGEHVVEGSDSDDEDADEGGKDDAEQAEESMKQISMRMKASQLKHFDAKKLRPASDILNRLRWDPNLDPSDFIVGYEDRFLGAKETHLERWKTEQTDEEFIPQHRILYFRRRGDGVVVWERKTRIDKIFGSGIGNGPACQHLE